MNEADTRAELIDKQLEAVGWYSGGEVRVQREYPINAGEIQASGGRKGKLKADYVLSYKNCKLAVIEAKKAELDVSEGVGQAKLYAQKLGLDTSFSANGKAIYQICHKTGTEGLVSNFPTPEALWHKTFAVANEWLKKFNAVPFENMNGTKETRYYQEIAVNKVMEAIANDNERVLLTLATGTGKTFIAFQIAWKLFISRWNKQRNGKRQPRILFLADRVILAEQARGSFGAFKEDALVQIRPDEITKKGEVPKNGSVFFTIFQTFMSGEEGEPHFGKYERDFFDIVIIDECHRGGANDQSSWRDILNYFNSAVHLGLTATPKRDANIDTYQYFGDPVYSYSLKAGIQDGFLTPFKVKRIQSTIDEYSYSIEDEVVQGEVDLGRVYKGHDFNNNIEIEARERKQVQTLLSEIKQDEKTIVFCANQAHAAMIRDMINQESKNTDVDYCVRVTANDGIIGNNYLKQFRDDEKQLPTILTTSHKLSTGVDARNVRNIVLMRPIKSMIEFKQIIGRGTRLYEEKHFFTIIDFFNAYHLFNDPEWDGEPIDPVQSDEAPYAGRADEIDIEKYANDKTDDENRKPKKLIINLAEGKALEIKNMISTLYYFNGKQLDVESFLKQLYKTTKLPSFFDSEEKLRTIWGNPQTRQELMNQLAKVGFEKDDLLKLQSAIEAENSDLFDVLRYIAFNKKPISRANRVRATQDNIYAFLNAKERAFIGYVLQNYVDDGVDELDHSRISNVLEAKYGSISTAEQQLGDLGSIRQTFIKFQAQLYKKTG